jgi:hypothetical protein
MNKRATLIISIFAIICIFTVGFLFGATMYTGYFDYSKNSPIPNEISAPTWEYGKYWNYSFKTPEIENVVSRIVIASDDGTDYLIGVASRLDAQRHAVLNYNPMLGRITMENFSIYEKGIPQTIFSFPLKKNIQWSFSMFGIEQFDAKVVSIMNLDLPNKGKTTIVNIIAEASSGESLIYSYDTSAKWINSLVLKDSSGNDLLDMKLISHGMGYVGEVYFVRARDLFSDVYSSSIGSPALDLYNSFLDRGHPNWGDWDYLVYYYEVVTGENSGGTLIVADPLSKESMKKVIGPNTFENTLGTIPSQSGEWKVSLALRGDSDLELQIAGGIEYIWTV